MGETAKVRIKLDPTGRGTVEIDGKDFTHNTKSTVVVCRACEITRVYLELINVSVEVDVKAEVIEENTAVEAGAED